MKKVLSLAQEIAACAAIILAYLFSVLVGASLAWVLGLFFLSLIALVWIVVRILKDPWSINKTFDKFFYQNRPDFRHSGKE